MPFVNKKPRTLYDKVFQDHIVDERDGGTILLYIGARVIASSCFCPVLTFCIDRHLVHEVTSPVSIGSSWCHAETNRAQSKPLRG